MLKLIVLAVVVVVISFFAYCLCKVSSNADDYFNNNGK